MRIPSLVLLAVCLALPARAQIAVQLVADDGQPLSGRLYPAKKEVVGGVVLLPMYRSDQSAYAPLAPVLASRGLHVLALDPRGHGGSTLDQNGKTVDVGRNSVTDPATNPFLKMHKDAMAALAFLVEKGAPKDRLALVGASVGCSIALHTAITAPESVRAIVLLTPGTNYLNVPSVEHAPKFGDRPALLLSSEEEADQGARPLKALMPSDRVTLRILEGTRIHGTRMFGKVPAIEVDIADWIERQLTPNDLVEIPTDKNVLLDGRVEASEALKAHRFSIPFEDDEAATVRLCLTKRRFVVGVALPERFMRRNAITLYLETAAESPRMPRPTTWRIQYNPAPGNETPLIVSQGEEGSWTKVERNTGVLAYASTRERNTWSAEFGLAVETFFPDGLAAPFRIALILNGATEGRVHYFPSEPGAELDLAPRTWQPFRFAK